MKKLIILVIFTIVLLSACGTLPTDANLPAYTPSNMNTVDELNLPGIITSTDLSSDDTVVLCTSKSLSGDFGRGMWSEAEGDMLVQALIDDASIITIDRNGKYIINSAVCNDISIVENNNGTTTYTVNLVQDLLYSDGTEVTAKDYVLPLLFFSSFAGDQAEAMDIGESIVGHDEYRTGQVYFLSGIRLIDRFTYSVTLYETDETFYDVLKVNSYPMNITFWLGDGCEVMDQGDGAFIQGDLSISTIEDILKNARTLDEGRVSCGPFKLVDYNDATKAATLELNPYYKGNNESVKPKIKRLIICNSDDNHIEMLLRNDVNVIDALKDPEHISLLATIAADYNIGYSFFERNGFGKLIFQCDWGATQFVEVRKAFAHLVNREQIIYEYLKGAGTVVNGPFSSAMWQYKTTNIANELDQYDYSFDLCVELLEASEWTLNSIGQSYSQGDGVRYKAVSVQAAQYCDDAIMLSDGTMIIPLHMVIALPEGSDASIAIKRILGKDENIKRAGFLIEFEEIPFDEEVQYLYRNSQEEAIYSQPKYGAFSFGMDFKAEYDMSDSFICDKGMQALGYNPSRYCNSVLEESSQAMLQYRDIEMYLKEWCKFVKEYNATLPELPLYINSYMSVYSNSITGYSESSFWGFDKAILYASIG